MSWADFYLVCFLVGFLLSVVTLVLGHVNVHLHIHLPHGGHFDFGGAHGGGHGHVAGHTAGGHGGGASGSGGHVTEISVINFATITAFLAWFGGSGYIFSRSVSAWYVLGLACATGFGILGAGFIFWVLKKLVSPEENLDPADYEMPGVLGRVTISIREGGTGEIVYVQAGTRRTCGARAEDGAAIAKGEEIVVTRYERGIAFVRRWEELAEENNIVEHPAAENTESMR
jgi:hypothetical protein